MIGTQSYYAEKRKQAKVIVDYCCKVCEEHHGEGQGPILIQTWDGEPVIKDGERYWGISRPCTITAECDRCHEIRTVELE